MGGIDHIKGKIARGELVIGTHVSLMDSSITELLGDVGFDLLWIDTEHSSIDKKDLQLHLIAARAAGVAAWVRIPWNDPVLAKPVLEMGPEGIVFPMIRTRKDAETAVQACMYPPAGIRGFGPRRAMRNGLMNLEEYIENAPLRFQRVMQIEHVEAVENLQSILEVDHVDAIVVGPNDLSGSLGILGKTDDLRVTRLLDDVATKAKRTGKPFGVSMGGQDPKVIGAWIERGADFIIVGSDTGYLARAGQDNLQAVKKLAASRGRRIGVA